MSGKFGKVSTFGAAQPSGVPQGPSFYTPPPKTLYTLTSKYFVAKAVDGERVFFPTPAIAADFKYIAEKEVTPVFEAILDELIGLYQEDNVGLKNLIFCSLACSRDGGVAQILADVQIMLHHLREYVRNEFYLGQSSTPSARAQSLEHIADAISGASQKIAMLTEADAYAARINRRRSAYGTRLQARLKLFPPDAPLWQLLRWLITRVERFARIALRIADTTDAPPAGQLELVPTGAQRQDPVRALWDELSLVGEATGTSITRPENKDIPANVVAAFACLEQMTDLWIRALAPVSDEQHYKQHLADSDPHIKSKSHGVAYDLESSVHMITDALNSATGTRADALRRCRADVGAIPRNWSILFNGKLGPRQGDKDIAFFRRPTQALRSMVLALAHIDTLRTSGIWEFKPYLRAGIGTGEVIVLDGLPQTIELNVAFKAIATSADIDRPAGMTTCSAVVQEEFANDHPPLANYRDAEVYTINGSSFARINWANYVQDLMAEFAT